MSKEAERALIEASNQFREMADRLGREAAKGRHEREFKVWWDDIHRGGFEERMAALEASCPSHAGKAKDERDALARTLRKLNIQIQVDRLRDAGMTKEQAIGKLAEITGLSIKQIGRYL